MYQVPLKNNEFLYNESFISELLKNAKLDKNSLTVLMDELGKSRDKIIDLMTKYVFLEINIVFDSTHIFSGSKDSNMNSIGYNSKKDFDSQINLFYMFSVDNQQPFYIIGYFLAILVALKP